MCDSTRAIYNCLAIYNIISQSIQYQRTVCTISARVFLNAALLYELRITMLATQVLNTGCNYSQAGIVT